jgi:MoaD family protein
MKINFYATYRQIVGGKTVDLPVAQGLTVRELIDTIVAQYPALRPELLDAAGGLYGHVRVIVAGRDSQFLDGALDTTLSSDETVDIFPPVGGGAR